ncbi:MAG: cell surface protein SprA [Flavobacteriaceae bacterium]|nr:cell surface protein SprA [Flavobacteriaceae bacterium]
MGMNSYGQIDKESSNQDLGKLSLPISSIIKKMYSYDYITDKYYLSETIGEYPIDIPLVLSPKEYEEWLLSESLKEYFKQKILSISGVGGLSELEESQKNLLPELYINNKYFQSIFGSDIVNIQPQGSVGIDLGVRYQKNDNPAASPQNRSNFGFDFDQRISLSLLGEIGERLLLTANYDTESTFDFQNLIKIQFNPPKIEEAYRFTEQINRGNQNSLINRLGDLEEQVVGAKMQIDDAKQKIQELRNRGQTYSDNPNALGNDVADFLDGKVTEDGILQNIDIGNISMPLNSNLIQGAQSLFGVRTDLKFGKTKVTGVFSEQRSQSQQIVTQGGGKIQNFEVFALDYEEDRHYFLSQFFRDQYDNALQSFPYINSNVQINRIEVWVTNRGSQIQNIRNIIAFQDLGEAIPENTKLGNELENFFTPSSSGILPDNESNNLNPQNINNGGILTDEIRDISSVQEGFGNQQAFFKEGIDYAVLESARKLNSNEYNFHPQLGYISLNQRLSNDEVLAVAFQYTYNGKVYQVGEFANGSLPGTTLSSSENSESNIQNNSLVTKLLKSNLTDVTQPVWDLMMKNIYNTGAFNLEEEDFRLNILYTDPSPINYLNPIDESIWPESIDNQTLIRTFGLDKLNIYKDPVPDGDGFFDYIPGITIEPNSGRIIFPKVEPFGEFLFKLFISNSLEDYEQEQTFNENQKKYVFKEMYSLTKAAAFEYSEKNKFQLKGRYTSSESDGISVGAFNIPRGSVVVNAGGRILSEGIDYTVNYEIGRVNILDPSLKASNVPISISVENNSFFNQQNRRFAGINIDHQISENVAVGGTLMNLSERPLTQKANYGTEPVNNTMIGFNTNFSTEMPFINRLINKIPALQSDIPSILSFRGEVASLISGNPRNTKLDGETNVYIDDFEGAQTNIDIKGFNSWRLGSVPFKNYKGSEKINNDISAGFGRAKLAWYSIDPVFYTESRPGGINNNDISLNKTRRIFINEIFPEQDLVQGTTTVQSTFDLAYYPDEKGPYNNSSNQEFNLDLKQNWASITRPLSSTNFEQSNVEFIEFWLLDTFSEIESNTGQLGQLVFHLGNISEDILKDGRKQYENGLPGSNDGNLIHNTSWGQVPAVQSLLYAFNTIEQDRVLQDVGLDGLNDIEERNIYTNGPLEDPAGDNYQFFVSAEGNILDRYKNYNGTEGNSPIAFSNTERGNTTEPDTEDINRDQSMNTIDSYFEYRVPISSSMTVGNHPFITDVRENVKINLPNGKDLTTRWIQFKIPIRKEYYQSSSFSDYFEAVNNIQDLRSMRFMRMVLSGFDQPVVFRFGTLDLVRGDWRRFNKSLNEKIVDNNNTRVDISTVNILENENRIPINYVLPPSIQREQINNNNTIIRQNEQSLSFRVFDLQPMDYRGIFKNIELDMRQYEKIRMFLHAESIPGEPKLPGEGSSESFDNRIVAFIRLGTDYKDNYYQIEIPLKPTEYNSETSNKFSPEAVWIPESNSIEVSLNLLAKLKAKSLQYNNFGDAIYFDENLNRIEEFKPISQLPGIKKYKFVVKGNPSLGTIRNIMIGVKNPSENLSETLSGEVWFNELRISGIESQGGWAATGSMDLNITDLGSFSANGKFSTIGFGNIDQSPNQSNREAISQFDLVSEFNLGKVLPKKWGIILPLNIGLGETNITPEYDPFYQDILLKDRLDTSTRSSQRDSIKSQAIDYTKRKSISLIGVRKISFNENKKRIYSPENFDFSYAYNEMLHHDYEIEDQKHLDLLLAVNYSYSFSSFEIKPFSKIKKLNQKNYWQWLKELNFSPIPSSLSITTNINRSFRTQRFREIYTEGIDAINQLSLPNLEQRNFLFDWNYRINHNLTKSLRISFNAYNNRIIRNFDPSASNKIKNAIWDNIWDVGEANNYNQSISANYKLPFRFIPFLSFLDANYNYTGDFSWQRGPEGQAEVMSEDGSKLGIVNTVQNANTKTFSGAISFQKLYSTLGLNDNKKPIQGNNIVKDKKKESRKQKNKKRIKRIVDLLNTIKRLQFNYSENNGTVLPGFLPSLGFFGTNRPSTAFTFGSQADIRYESAKKGWITSFTNFNQTFNQIHNYSLNISTQWSPFKDLVVDLNIDRNYSENKSENFRLENSDYIPLNPNIYGNFGTSTILIKTAFDKLEDVNNPIFEKFRNNRIIISNRLVEINSVTNNEVDSDGFPYGFGKNHQLVLIGAFISAYSGIDPNKIDLNPINRKPLPNWNLKYTGLSNLSSFKKVFERFTLSHAYRASFTLNNFQSNLDFDPILPQKLDGAGNIITEKIYSNINLVEQFNPLIRLDLEFKNSFRFLAEFKKDRALSLSLDNSLLTESSGNEFILGLGYRVKDVRMVTRIGGKRSSLSGDLNIKADVSYRKNLTVLRNLEYNNNQVTAGQTQLSIKFSSDYSLSRNLTALLFYDHNFSEFVISTAFPQTTIRSGITIRYNFGN